MSNLADANDTIHELLLPIDQADPDGRQRDVVFQNLPNGEMELSLLINEEIGGAGEEKDWIRLSLGVSQTCNQNVERSEWDDILVPVVPLVYTTVDRDRTEADQASDGWIYVFVDGNPWREIRIERRGLFRDVNLKRCAGKDVREATGATDNRIVVPHKIGGNAKTVEMCFSRVQWSWKQIGNATGYGVDAINFRIARTIKLPLEQYKTDFDLADGDVGPICDAPNVPLVRLQRSSRLPVVYLDDPIGIAQRLKYEHFSAVADAEFLSEQMDEEDYRLARLIDGMIKQEEQIVQKQGEDGKGPSTNVRGSVNAEKLKDRLDYWERRATETNKNSYKTGMDVVNWLEGERGGGIKVSFEMALQEYLADNTPERFALGLAVWCELVEYFYFTEGRAYIKRIIDQHNEIGTLICNPSSAQGVVVGKLETGKYYPGRNDGFHLTGKDAISLTKFGAKVFSSLVNSLAQAAVTDEIQGLDWVGDLIKKYLPDLEVTVQTAPIHLMWSGVDQSQPHHYRLIPRPSEIEKRVRAKYVHLGDADLPKSAAALQQSALYTEGFGTLLVALEIINLAQAIKTISNELEKDQTQVLVLTASILSGMATLTGLASKALEIPEGAREARYRELAAEYRKKYGEMWRKGRAAKNVDEFADKRRAERLTAAALVGEHKTYRTLNRTREIAATTSRLTGQLAAYVNLGLTAWDLAKAFGGGSTNEKVWTTVKTASMLMSAMGLNQIATYSGVLFKLRAAAGVTMLAGESTLLTGWGFVLFVVGLGLEMVSSTMLREHKPGELEKAINSGYFGKQPYKTMEVLPHGPYTEPSFKPVHEDTLGYNSPAVVGDGVYRKEYYPWAVKPELRYLYNLLFDYAPAVKIMKTGQASWVNRNGVGKVEIQPDGERVIVGEVAFSRFLPRNSTLEVEFVYKVPGMVDEQVVRLDEMVAVEDRDGDVLRKLTCYHPLGVLKVTSVTMRCLLDVHGDGEFLVPLQPGWDDNTGTKPLEIHKREVSYHMATVYDNNWRRKAARERVDRSDVMQVMRKDFYRRVLTVMDTAERSPQYDLGTPINAIRRLHSFLLRSEPRHDAVLDKLQCTKPGGAEWDTTARQAERYA